MNIKVPALGFAIVGYSTRLYKFEPSKQSSLIIYICILGYQIFNCGNIDNLAIVYGGSDLGLTEHYS